MKKLNKKNLKKASPTLLSCFGAVGVIGTSALAVKATPKALRKIRADSRENHNDPNAYTKLEAIQSAWIYYVPSVVMGSSNDYLYIWSKYSEQTSAGGFNQCLCVAQ